MITNDNESAGLSENPPPPKKNILDSNNSMFFWSPFKFKEIHHQFGMNLLTGRFEFKSQCPGYDGTNLTVSFKPVIDFF